jgi:hypothetical protein
MQSFANFLKEAKEYSETDKFGTLCISSTTLQK